jgi:hypothetical protein
VRGRRKGEEVLSVVQGNVEQGQGGRERRSCGWCRVRGERVRD